MQLQSLPLELQFGFVDYLSGDDILTLSISNKYFYAFLKTFRILMSCMVDGKQTLIWPTLDLSYQVLKKDYYFQIQKLKHLHNFRFVYHCITIDFPLYTKVHSFLPPAKNLLVIEDPIHAERMNHYVPNYRETTRENSTLFSFSKVTRLSFTGVSINDENIQSMQNMKNLKALELESVNLNWNLFCKGLPNTRITELVLKDYPNTNDWSMLFAILPQTNIERLCLNGMAHDLAVNQLAIILPYCQVETLNLQGNGISDNAATALAKVLAQSNLKDLNLSFNNLTAKSLRLFAAALPKSNIQQIDFTHNNFQPDDMYLLYEKISLTKIQRLLIKGIGEKSEMALAKNLPTSSISSIKYDSCFVYSEKILRSLNTSNIKEMEIVGSGANFSAMILSRYISSIPVQKLSLSDSKIDEESVLAIFRALTKSSSLKELTLNGIHLPADLCRDISTSLPNTNLVALSFNRSRMMDIALLNLIPGILNSTLKRISIALENQLVTVEGLLYFVCAIKNSQVHTLCVNPAHWRNAVSFHCLKRKLNDTVGNGLLNCRVDYQYLKAASTDNQNQ
ncbi:hypothetical protein HDV01_007097 [Terramyces sp. JEL0728]|nr:hypothetical protein HDV01_007097 [Terramyces sp. JEL0728]